MQLTSGQEAAIKAISMVQQSHPDGGGLVVISGFAGTGKTTLLKVISEDHSITVVTPTGKAALRVKEVSDNVNASTIHSWLYEVSEDEQTGKLLTTLKESYVIPSKRVLFVDEASMVSLQVFKDMYKVSKMYGINLVFFGDPFQLPPIEAKEEHKGFSVLAPDFPAHYKVNMTEIVRQALDSPIIRASMALRDLRSDLSELTDLPTVRNEDLIPRASAVVEDGGFVICHRNVTRNALNNSVRQFRGYGELVLKGEPLLVLHNNRDLEVYNGEIVTVLDKPVLLGDKHVSVNDRVSGESQNMYFYQTRIEGFVGPSICLFADREVAGQNGNIKPSQISQAGKKYSRDLFIKERALNGEPLSYTELQEAKGTPVVNANFGYAATCHKLQGSEAQHCIVVVEDSIKLNKIEGRKFLYTAVTRAKQKCEICWS